MPGEEVFRPGVVILAMGSAAQNLNDPGEQSLLGRDVSAYATYDGFFFRGQDIVAIDGDQSAMERGNIPREVRHQRDRCASR